MGEGMDTLTIGALLNEVRLALAEHLQGRLVIDCNVENLQVTIPRRSLKRVMRGLIANAFYASTATGAVTLRVVVDDAMLRFEVGDQGRGMDRETAAKACEPFFTTKPAGQGLGLGLYLARILAERLGGGLEIDSTPGVGTMVRFWIHALIITKPEM